MRAFNEKCDNVLVYLKVNTGISWESFYADTKLKKDDAIITFLKSSKGFIRCNEHHIYITHSGLDFISKTSFVQQRKNSSEL